MKRFLILGVALALMATSTASLSAAGRKGMMGVGVGGGVNFPMGHFGDGFKLGWRAAVGFGYFVTDNIAIGVSGAYGQNKAKDDLLTKLQSVDSNVTDAKSKGIEFGAWGKYFFKTENEKVAPYVTLGLGGNNNKAEITPDTAAAFGSSTGSETFLGGKVGVGAMFKVSPTASIFVEGDFHNYAKSDFQPVNYIAAQAGVVFMFGKPSGGGGTTE